MNAFRIRTLLAAGAALVALAAPARAQDPVLLQLRAGAPLSDRFRVDSSGAFVAYGFVRDVTSGTGCAPQIPASGAGTRFMWHPCRGAFRFGRAPSTPSGSTTWDDANMNDFTFGGGNQVIADGYGAFAFGDQVTVTSTVGVGFGSGVTVSGTAGFSAGASNVCAGFACTALGYTVRAGGQGSVSLGYRTSAIGDYTVAIGYRASSNSVCPAGPDAGTPCRGTFAAGDESTTDSVRNQTSNEFRIRYNGGIRLRVSTASNGNTPGAGGNVGCDLTVAVPSWTCASSRTLKENFADVDGEDVLSRIRTIPITTWNMIGGDRQVRHLGPVAEDFHRAFPLGLGETTIGLGDIDGVNLAAAKALEQRTTRLQAQLDERTAQVQALQARLDAQEALLAELRAQVQALARAPAAPARR
ncbi:MAG TPA: tail fiber domain-containing protein [Longimicrobium sp.]|nr:tail fiber domain-containing protein [Longimicrobium sp.]